eukprot:1152443-Pelagomonas_calceolata.AAC.2
MYTHTRTHAQAGSAYGGQAEIEGCVQKPCKLQAPPHGLPCPGACMRFPMPAGVLVLLHVCAVSAYVCASGQGVLAHLHMVPWCIISGCVC